MKFTLLLNNRFTAVLILIVVCLFTKAQSVYLYDSKLGLSSSQIQTMYEDSRHNIWITTRNGLNRYDGAKMNAYHHSNKDESSLKHDITTCVLEYDHDRMLIGTDGGIQSFDYHTNKFKYVPLIRESGDTLGVHIISMTKLRSGETLACIAAYGTAKIEEGKKGELHAKVTLDYNTGNDNSPIQIFQDSKERIWIINSEGCVFLKNGKHTQAFPEIKGAKKMCESSSGNIYACSSTDGIFVLQKNSSTFKSISNEKYNYWSISPWTDGRIFICTDGNGLLQYSEATGEITLSPLQYNNLNMKSANVKDVLCDSFGSIWIGVYWTGVMQKPLSQSVFKYIGRLSITHNSIGTNPITAMAPASNKHIWVATDHDGLYKVNEDGSESIHWSTADNAPSTINAICTDNKHGKVWLGSFANGLYCLDNATGKIQTCDKQFSPIFDIESDDEGSLWIGTMGNGLYYYNPMSGKVVNFNTQGISKDKKLGVIANKYVTSVTVSGNSIYVGTSDGLDALTIIGKSGLKSKHRYLVSVYINDIKKNGNEIWVATNKGLYVINENTKKETLYNADNGLPNNVVNSIEFDGDNVWMSTDNGLACFNKKTKSFHNFFAADGLQNNEFSVRSSLKNGNTLYFGGITGINFFTSADINEYDSNTKINFRIVDLYVSNSAVHVGDLSNNDYVILDKNIDEADEVNLAYNENHFTLELASVGLGYRRAIFEYSLDGSEWIIQNEQSNRIVFANLKPGTHKLKIRARTYNSVSEERELSIIVHHPWYSSSTAWIIYILLLIIISWTVYTQAHRQIQARRILANHRKEEELNEARIQFFMNISHEIRTPMTLIFAPLEKLMSSDKDEEHQRNYKLIHQNSKRIMRLINQMMDARKIEKGQYKLDFKAMDVVDFMQGIFDVFTTNAQNRNIKFEFRHSMSNLYAKADPENLDKILMNLLSNAFKFTPDCGKIILELRVEGNIMIIKVTDNGSGISDEDKPKIFERFYSAQHQNGYIGTGIGLNLTYLIVKMHKGDIRVLDNPDGKGTQFVITLPLMDVKASAVEAIEVKEMKDTHVETVALPVEKLKGVRHRNVLVVEDDEAIRTYIHSELSSDMVITECTNGQEGWNYLIKNPTKVDLIISDIMMPVMDGITLCQKIKQNFNTSHLPVILISALGTDSDRIAGISNGADAYVTKPFNIDVLRSTAINLLVSRLALQGKFATSQKTEEHIEKREIESADEHLLNRVIKVINANMEDPELSVEVIADKVGISRVHFYRKMKELTGQSPRDFLKTIRLKEAARLLSEKRLDITSVCAATGFKTLSTFSTSFKSVYGVSPSEYANRNNE